MRGDAGDGRPRRRLAFTVAAVVVALDALTKALAAHLLRGRGLVTVAGGALHLRLYRNHIGPGNSLPGHPVLISAITIAAVIAIAAFAWTVRTTTPALTCGLLLGGGAGNLIDRLATAPGPLRGGVIDWLAPTAGGGSMNLADVAIDLALVVLVLGTAVEWWRARGRPPRPGPSAHGSVQDRGAAQECAAPGRTLPMSHEPVPSPRPPSPGRAAPRAAR